MEQIIEKKYGVFVYQKDNNGLISETSFESLCLAQKHYNSKVKFSDTDNYYFELIELNTQKTILTSKTN